VRRFGAMLDRRGPAVPPFPTRTEPMALHPCAGTPRLATLSLALAAAFAAVVASSAALAQQPAAPEARAQDPYLTRAAAAARTARLSNLAYTLDMHLTGEPTFAGDTTVAFDLSDAGSPLTLDLDKATIGKLVVNGHALTPDYNDWFITLPAASLKKGRNTVEVAYTRAHSTNGEGLHRYVDKADGRVYLYTHFEPAAAHQMFPTFDQPDPKATYTLRATAPKDWVVISSTPEAKVEDAGNGMRKWTFPTTPRLSVYNFSMHAGPYKMWEDRSGKYPMRLFARQSVASQVAPADWFKYTKAGLAYYDDYFGIPYPFKKYDQVLVPQFIYGAMENASAITFTETRFLSEKAMTAERRQMLASVILHEMAHQWFGDLVTMRWWNGLWLNESFASYMSTLASARSGEFPNPWLSFYRAKQGAYRQDESVTTHPVEVPVASTLNAFDNIDAITYNKGASTLHQLRVLIGDDAFRRGVHDYLVAHSYNNATLEDFIGALSKSSGRDLTPWAQEWLYQPGVDTLAVDFACEGGKISRFRLQQAAANPANPTLRSQRVQVGLFAMAGDKLALSGKQTVDYSGVSTDVPQLVGQACPDLAYPNYEDWGFAKVVLDPASFATARAHLTQVDDPMLRSMLWQSLTDGLTDQRIGLDDYVDATIANLPKETDYTLLRQALGNLGLARGYLRVFGGAHADALTVRMEDAAWAGVMASRGQRDQNLSWLSTYIDVAGSAPAMARLRGMLDGKVDAGGAEIDQETRWSILEQLNRNDVPGTDALIAAELDRDKSESGQLSALGATLVRPDAARKQAWLAKVQALDGSEPFSRLRVAMGGMYPGGQEALDEASADQRLATLAAIDAKADPVFMRSYAGSMLPATCTPASVARLQRAIDGAAGLHAGTRRSLVETQEGDVRCVAIRAAWDKSLATPAGAAR
jgi:aminopeptidase N